MPATGETLRVEGLAEMQRAFRVADRSLSRELRSSLREVAEPVRSDAEHLASAAIPRIGVPWSRMRVGITRHTVYVAPRQRGARDQARKRRNLAGLLMDRAMLPALRVNEQRIVHRLEDMLDEVGRDWERS